MAKGEIQRHGKFDEKARMIFLRHYEEFGMAYQAAAAAGVCMRTVNNTVKDDEEFALAYEESKGKFRDSIEQEIRRRSMEGVLEYVTCGKGLVFMPDENDIDPVTKQAKLKPVLQRKFSDNLLMFHARRHIEAYRDKSTIDHNVKGGVLLVPSGMSLEEWKASQAKPINVTPQPPALPSANKK